MIKSITISLAILLLSLSSAQSRSKPRPIEATITGFECGDYCHLLYQTAVGEEKSAICSGPEICGRWLDNPQSFKKMIGAKVSITLTKQYVPEAGGHLDSIYQIILRDTH